MQVRLLQVEQVYLLLVVLVSVQVLVKRVNVHVPQMLLKKNVMPLLDVVPQLVRLKYYLLVKS